MTCQFFLGRDAYQRQDYHQAALHWQWTADRSADTIDDERIIAAAHGTLGYLYYRGLGVAQDQTKALELFREGVRRGDLESRLHLGRAYADDRNAIYNPVLAYAWLKSVENFYRPIIDEQLSMNVLDDAKKALAILKGALTDGEIAKGEELSWTIRQ